jgi:glycerophosphoryl diester phosphodiesterase
VVVVNHDADLMRMARDPRKIATTDYADFANARLGHDGDPSDDRRLARLDEFLERAHGRIRLAIELKYYGWDEQLGRQVVSEIRARHAEADVMLISLSLQAIEQVRRLAPEIESGYLSSVSVGSLDDLPVKALALSRQRSTAQTISDAHARRLQVYVWTLNDAAGMVEMIGRGADGIITDDPRVAVRVRNELRTMTSTELLLLRFSDALTDQEERDEVPSIQ